MWHAVGKSIEHNETKREKGEREKKMKELRVSGKRILFVARSLPRLEEQTRLPEGCRYEKIHGGCINVGHKITERLPTEYRGFHKYEYDRFQETWRAREPPNARFKGDPEVSRSLHLTFGRWTYHSRNSRRKNWTDPIRTSLRTITCLRTRLHLKTFVKIVYLYRTFIFYESFLRILLFLSVCSLGIIFFIAGCIGSFRTSFLGYKK